MRTALFPGSFDPFTRGHQSIVNRTVASIADRVIIAIGVNYNKKYTESVEVRIEKLKQLYADNPHVEIISYEGLTTDCAAAVGADFIVRGIRCVKDFEYERDIAEVNRRLTGIETVFLFTEPELAHISSTIARELKSYNKDITDYLPK